MPGNKYLDVWIGGRKAEITAAEDFPIGINYKLEDTENFQSKKSSEIVNLVLPATTSNDKIANVFHNPGFEDMSPGQQFRSFQRGLVEANGYELMVGKALLIEASHDSLPLDYEFEFYGNNGDWIVPLKEVPLHEFLKHITFSLTKELIVASWAFDGTDENLPYVFAPVRYGLPMETFEEKLDYNMVPLYMRPALSVYWLIYWGFKSQGYKISSEFMDTNYFRRLTMPWTWGNFLYSEGTNLDELKFRAKSSQWSEISEQDYNDYLNVFASNETTNGAFDNNGVYDYNATTFEMNFTYIPGLDFGVLSATLRFQATINASATANSAVDAHIDWFKNGVLFKQEQIMSINAPTIGRRDFNAVVDLYATTDIVENDIITAKVWAHVFDSGVGRAYLSVFVESFELDYFNIPLGGTINFANFNSFKQHKWIDFLAGILDCFNISPQTDPINKVVTLEPMHPYSLVQDQSEKEGGYFNGNHLDWEHKQDLSKKSTLPLVSDSERELVFKFKDDSNDGILKKVQDRNQVKLAASKYVFPDRFKSGKKEFENRFFSPVVHYRPNQWGDLGGAQVPQMICMIPENVSNTSKDEAQNTFTPKLTWYKGVTEAMQWMFDGEIFENFPYMFAVNYLSNGAADPVLSYCDEYVIDENDGPGPGPGLLRRFYLQRMAILRNGQAYKTFFKLNNLDVTNWLHREHIACRGQKWELVEINDYKPLKEETTGVYLRKHSPITQADSDSVFPSIETVAAEVTPTDPFDTRYAPLKALTSDILQEIP